MFRLIAPFFAGFLAIAVMVGLVMGVSSAKSCIRSNSEAAIAEEIRDVPPVFNLTAGQLVVGYMSDEAAGAVAYNGQVGIIHGIVAGSSDQANHVKLLGGAVGALVWSLRCYLSDEELEKVIAGYRRSSANRVTLKGRVEGVDDKHLAIGVRGCALQ